MKMAQRREVVYGFIMNAMSVIKHAIDRRPKYRHLIETSPFDAWQHKVMDLTVEGVGNAVDIPDLRLDSVWIGGGRCACCWVLPKRFWPNNIKAHDLRRLHSLKVVLCITDLAPRFFNACGDDDEPENLRDAVLPKQLVELSMDSVVDAFHKDAKGVLEAMYSEGTTFM